MSALDYLVNGTFAMTYGDAQVDQPIRDRLKAIAKAFGIQMREVARANTIPLSAIPAWRAEYLWIGFDQAEIYFLFLDVPGNASVHFNDITGAGHVGIQ